MTAYFTDLEGIRRVPRGFWRDKDGNDAIWSGVAPKTTSAQGEWIFVSRAEYAELLSAIGMADVPGSDLVANGQKQQAEPSSRRPMSVADIQKAADLLKAETRTRRLTRDEQRLWIRQAFSDKNVTELDCRKIFGLVPVKIGAPSKADRNSDK